MKKYLSRQEVRKIIKRCLELELSLSEIKQTVRHKEQQEKDFIERKYGW